jgi:hypothetical protein
VWLTLALRPERIREHLVNAVNDRFGGRVDAETAQISVVPKPAISGTGVRIYLRNAAADLPPLVSIDSFEASAPYRGLVSPRVQLGNVTLNGTDIRIPPGGLSPAVASLDTATTTESRHKSKISIIIDEIVSRDARLEIATRKANKLPRVFEIHDLVLRGFGLPEGAKFQAGVTNAIPRGRVETTGIFGPWLREEPTLTPIRGEYSFKHADLNDIKGIGGIEVDGQTETPDFSLDLAKQPVPLFTRFKAIVDGTNGDTWLDRVDAKLGESNIVASGAIVRDRDVKGRHVALDIQIRQARIEDVLRLAVKAAKAPMTGGMELTTTFLLPSGAQDVIDRLNLNGRFSLKQARFSNIDVQRRIEALSLRARGKQDEEASETGSSVVSNLRGRFVMRGAKIDFKELTFSIPGAEVQLAGLYDLHSEALDFKGDLLVDASLAQMTTGFKSFLARLAQPFFRREGGGSKFPIKITGPRTKPEFGLDMGRVFRRG